MTTIELAKKELKFTIDDLKDLYDLDKNMAINPLNIYPCSEKGYGTIMTIIFYQRWIEEIKIIDQYFNQAYNNIKNQSDLFLTQEEIQQFALEKTKILQHQIQDNKWAHLLSLNNYHLITNMFFILKIHKPMFEVFDKKFNAFQKEYYPQQRSHKSLVEKYNEIVQEDFFAEFTKLLRNLTEVKLLQILRKKLQVKQKAYSTPNYYPLVFKNKTGYQLFHYCMEGYSKTDITKTILSKYFEFFKNDDLILENVRPKNFFNFIKKDFDIDISRLEPYTSSDKTAKEEYESMKNTFFAL